MKTLMTWVAFGLGFCCAVRGGDFGVRIEKGRILSQTSSGAPVLLGSGAFLFRVEADGLGGPPTTSGASLKLPNGTTRSLPYADDDDVYRLLSTADTSAALATTYPAGTYDLTLTTSFGALTAGGTLGPDAFPPAANVVNHVAGQAIDPDADFAVQIESIVGAAADDEIEFQVWDGAESIIDDVYAGVDTEFIVSSGTLQPARSYEARLRIRHLLAGAGDLLVAGIGFSSETRFTLKTASGGGPVDVVAPTLVQSSPTNHAGNVLAQQPLGFFFSEPMDPSKVHVQWGGPVSPAQVHYLWSNDGTALICTYGDAAAGFPAGTITWSLNPVAGAADNFRDTAGNELPAGIYSGDFTVGGSNPAGCDGASPVESAGFGILKTLNLLQSGPGTPVDDPAFGAQLLAFSRITDIAGGRAALEFPPDPAPKPHQLKFFAAIVGNEFLVDQFPTQAALDAAYPPGTFDFQVRDRTTPTVELQHVVLSLPVAAYPPVPHFSGFTASQSINPGADFTLAWDAYAGASAETDALAIQISDADGLSVFRLPDACAGKPLAVTATSVVVPKDTFKAGSTYTAELTFYRLSDQGKAMPGSTAKGLTATSRVTRMALKAAGGAVTPSAPVFVRYGTMGSQFELIVDCTPGRVLKIDSAATPGGVFTTVSTTTPAASPATVLVPVGAVQGYFRARVE